MYLSSAVLDRKRRERSAAPTSLIISRSRHPFFEKTDVLPVLMEVQGMILKIVLMARRRVVSC